MIKISESGYVQRMPDSIVALLIVSLVARSTRSAHNLSFVIKTERLQGKEGLRRRVKYVLF